MAALNSSARDFNSLGMSWPNSTMINWPNNTIISWPNTTESVSEPAGSVPPKFSSHPGYDAFEFVSMEIVPILSNMVWLAYVIKHFRSDPPMKTQSHVDIKKLSNAFWLLFVEVAFVIADAFYGNPQGQRFTLNSMMSCLSALMTYVHFYLEFNHGYALCRFTSLYVFVWIFIDSNKFVAHAYNQNIILTQSAYITATLRGLVASAAAVPILGPTDGMEPYLQMMKDDIKRRKDAAAAAAVTPRRVIIRATVPLASALPPFPSALPASPARKSQKKKKSGKNASRKLN